jgi:hypothetical protein
MAPHRVSSDQSSDLIGFCTLACFPSPRGCGNLYILDQKRAMHAQVLMAQAAVLPQAAAGRLGAMMLPVLGAACQLMAHGCRATAPLCPVHSRLAPPAAPPPLGQVEVASHRAAPPQQQRLSLAGDRTPVKGAGGEVVVKVAEGGMMAAAMTAEVRVAGAARLAVGVGVGAVEAAGLTPTWRTPPTLTSVGMSTGTSS